MLSKLCLFFAFIVWLAIASLLFVDSFFLLSSSSFNFSYVNFLASNSLSSSFFLILKSFSSLINSVFSLVFFLILLLVLYSLLVVLDFRVEMDFSIYLRILSNSSIVSGSFFFFSRTSSEYYFT